MGIVETMIGIIVILCVFGSIICKRLVKQYAQDPIRQTEKDKDFALNMSFLGKWFRFLAFFFTVSYFIYIKVQGTPWQAHLQEWMDLIIRWLHIIFGIAWIGASFYFVFLENSLNRSNVRDELQGNLWAIHGGGFYFLEKYKGAPNKMPKHLHWFKYEAYFTWLTGTCLLIIVYYFNAESFLINPEITHLTPVLGVMIGISSILISYAFYELLSNPKMLAVERRPLFFLVMFIYLAIVAYVLSIFFNPRAAYIHLGAIMGTMMAGNVFFCIIPAQKEMVFAAKEGREPDVSLGQKAGWRSYHNNYFTLPVLFIMISNHFPSTFGNEHNIIILALLSLAGAGIKHFHNQWERGETNYWIIPVSISLIISAIYITAPLSREDLINAEKVSFSTIFPIVQKRCQSCHSKIPTDDVFIVAQGGVMFDTPEQIVQYKDQIMNRAIITKTMPQGNKTRMTQKERDLIETWIMQGAKLD
ncbi:MAG: urate hydroxylase PuuD [Saprospiraceae bacterium]|nr:urate hydroxylase PuuD [Saprospiraceae bacterium]